MRAGALLLLLFLALVIVGMAGFVLAGAEVINVNISNSSVNVSFTNITIVNFTKTSVSMGWVNQSSFFVSYLCLYQLNYTNECHVVNVIIYNNTVPVYNITFNPNSTIDCAHQVPGICSASARVNVSGFNVVNVLVRDLTTGKQAGPFSYEFPYHGPRLEGYASYISLIIPLGILFGLAGRLNTRNIGIGLFVYGLILPVTLVLGANIRDVALVSTISIVFGLILIWFS